MNGMSPGQIGRLIENLVEAAYTTGTYGRLSTYLPVVDAFGVDRVVSLEGGPPLFVQVQGLLHRNAMGHLTYHTVERNAPASVPGRALTGPSTRLHPLRKV